MDKLQMEELKLSVFMVGIASADDWVFRALMLLLACCSVLQACIIRKTQRLQKELEELQQSNP